MTLYHLIIDSSPILDTFSPVELVETIMTKCKGKGELPIDIWTSEVK
jgi:hypothetical protein